MTKTHDYRLTLRLKPEEYAVLKAKAGDKPLSAYVRETVLAKAELQRNGPKTAPVKDHLALAQVLALLGQHQLVSDFKRVNGDVEAGVQPVDDETKALLRDCRDFLGRIHSLLMDVLGVNKQ